jgi:hypothetical protein
MVFRGDDASDEEAKLVGREYGVSDASLKSSNADKGRGWFLVVFVKTTPRVCCCLILGLTMLCCYTEVLRCDV